MEKFLVSIALMLFTCFSFGGTTTIVLAKISSNPKLTGAVETEGGEYFHGSWFSAKVRLSSDKFGQSRTVEFTAPSRPLLKKGQQIWAAIDSDNPSVFLRWGHIEQLECLHDVGVYLENDEGFDLKMDFGRAVWLCRESK